MAERNPLAQYRIRRLALELRSFTLNELSSAAGTTSQTIYSFVHDLKKAGEHFISTEDLPSEDQGPGRPPVRYRLSPQGLEFLADENFPLAKQLNELAFAADPSLRPLSPRSRKSPAIVGSVRTLNKGLHFKGEITGAEDFEIDASVEGLIKLDQSKVTVHATANVQADIIAREVVIYGKVQGNVHAIELLCIKRDGSLTGDITTKRVMIEDGAYFKGSIEIDKGSGAESSKGSSSRMAEAAGARNRAAQSH
jgi:cytoskeletal protein CcmA (bactofilin family)